MLKKTTLAILGMSICGWASAGMYSAPPAPTCTPGDVTVPCETRLWDIGIQALYLQPIFDADRGYGISSPFFELPEFYKEEKHDAGVAYQIEGSYHFNTGNDITLSYLHFDVDGNLGTYQGVVGLGTIVVPTDYNLASTNKFNRVNLVLGQRADYAMTKHTRFYGGLQYANIQADLNLVYNTPPFLVGPTQGFFGYNNTNFNGVGPTVGVDLAYDLGPNFSLVANSAMAVLYGSSRLSTATFLGNGLVTISRYGSKKSIVPEAELKLGANFMHPFANGVLNIQGGYQVMNYFNALQNYKANFSNNIVDSDFGLYGPYVGVKWYGYA